MSGNAAFRRSSTSVRSWVLELPSLGSRRHIKGMPTPFQITDTIRMLMLVLPKSQFVRSIARTQGLPRRPSRPTTMRAATVGSSVTCWKKR
jgi:hypothetical protein